MIGNGRKNSHLHFVGIGGIGMSGIAEVLFNQGYVVSGSDLNESEATRKLKALGIRVTVGHAASNIHGATVVVISSAVKPNNPEVIEARRLRIPVIPRAEMLGELMRGKVGVAVAGTHGKTTTTSILATILTEAGLDPTIVIGGVVNSLGGNAKLGQGSILVAEADESDGSFLHLPATYGVVTNIDNDHLDYFASIEAIENAFVEFVDKLPFYGCAAVCLEDEGVRRCLSRFRKPVATYGLSSEADYYASDIQSDPKGSRFTAWRAGGHKAGEIRLNLLGSHNVLNTLAAWAICDQLEVPFDVVARALAGFHGVGRRFELKWKDADKRQAIIDDYAHHPAEILATLKSARQYWGKGRVISVFQPHRFSRTLHCHEGFLTAFRESDLVLLTDIYPAGEEPIEGVHSRALADMMQRVAPSGQKVQYVGNLDSTQKAVLSEIQEGDLVLCFGAGSITRLPEKLVQVLGG